MAVTSKYYDGSRVQAGLLRNFGQHVEWGRDVLDWNGDGAVSGGLAVGVARDRTEQYRSVTESREL